MKTKITLCGLAIAAVLQFGMLAGSAQTNIYLYSGSETNITLPPGTYIITAYGTRGGSFYGGGLGAEMSGEFNFSTSTPLTLLVHRFPATAITAEAAASLSQAAHHWSSQAAVVVAALTTLAATAPSAPTVATAAALTVLAALAAPTVVVALAASATAPSASTDTVNTYTATAAAAAADS